MKLGEEVDTAARRELHEETGLEPGDLVLFGIFSGPELFYVYPNREEVSNVTIVFLPRFPGGEICLTKEHTTSEWFAPGDIRKNSARPFAR